MATDDIKRYRDNLRDEWDGAALYTAIAAAEPDPIRKDLFLQLAQAESNHARLWREKLTAAGLKEEPYVPSFGPDSSASSPSALGRLLSCRRSRPRNFRTATSTRARPTHERFPPKNAGTQL